MHLEWTLVLEPTRVQIQTLVQAHCVAEVGAMRIHLAMIESALLAFLFLGLRPTCSRLINKRHNTSKWETLHMGLIIPCPLTSFGLDSHHTIPSLITTGLSLSTREVQTILGVRWLFQHGLQISTNSGSLCFLAFLLEIRTQHLRQFFIVRLA